jgi:hypothetical protein
LAEPPTASVRRQVPVPLRFPDKSAQLRRLGVRVTEQLPTGDHRGPANAAYLAAKAHHFTRVSAR